MTIPWVSGIPANTPATDQPDMLANNDNVPIYAARDHVAFGAANSGYHEQVHMQNNQSTPGLGGAVGVLYANVGSGVSQLFWDNGTTNQQISPNTLGQTNNGFIKIGNIMIQWGVEITGAASGTTTFTPNFSGNYYNVSTTPLYQGTQPASGQTATVSVNQSLPSAANFTWTFRTPSANYTGFYWIAIGPV